MREESRLNMARRQNQNMREKRRGRKRVKMSSERDGLAQKTKRLASQNSYVIWGSGWEREVEVQSLEEGGLRWGPGGEVLGRAMAQSETYPGFEN